MMAKDLSDINSDGRTLCINFSDPAIQIWSSNCAAICANPFPITLTLFIFFAVNDYNDNYSRGEAWRQTTHLQPITTAVE